MKKTTSNKDAWEELKKTHKSRGPVRKAVLYRQLYQMKRKPKQSMTQFVNDFMEKSELLEEVGIKIPAELLSIMLLSSLQEEYENFRAAIESRDEIPTIDNLKLKLIEEDARWTDANKNEENSQGAFLSKGKEKSQDSGRNKFSKSQNKFLEKCYNCGKAGHRISD